MNAIAKVAFNFESPYEVDNYTIIETYCFSLTIKVIAKTINVNVGASVADFF